MKFTPSVIFLLFCFVSNFSFGQSKLLSPDEFLPHKIGEQFTPHHLLVDYYEYVAANSPHVQLMQYGYTNEQRPLNVAFISTPENLARLEDIRLNHLRQTGLEGGTMSSDKDYAIVWLTLTVHGNEAAGSESALPLLYDLANPENETTKNWLENTIVIIDPCANPDGNSRYIHWYRRYANAIPNPNPASLEHQEPWPKGRVNHYLFDLNRDWAWATQMETQQRLKVYGQWMPHVHADLHEMGINSPYYFAPAARPYHEYITDWQGDFQQEIGKNHARYFDENGWLYFTREVFDLFYPSYGDTYPIFNGSIGMTYEQGGSGRAGLEVMMENGQTLSLKDRIAHHKTTALSTIEVASKNANRLNEHFKKYFKDAMENPQGEYVSYIIKGDNTTSKLERLSALLDIHHIGYGSVASELTTTAYNYETGEEENVKVEENDLIISAHQPKGVLAQVLFDPNAVLEDSLTYDITAWALPYAYGLEAYASAERISPSVDFTLEKEEKNTLEKAYAYALPWESVEDAAFLSEVLKAGIKARFANQAFQLGETVFERGTVVISRGDNPKIDLVVQLQKLIDETGSTLVPLATGFMDEGPDLGSSSYTLIHAPKVALVGERPTFANEFGQVWHYFEQELHYPLSILRGSDLSRADLSEYNVLILPEGRYRFSEATREKISEWVAEGGRLIAIGYAVRALADQSQFGLKSDSNRGGNGSEEVIAERLKVYGTTEREAISSSMAGAIFKTKMDVTHPLAYGLPDTYFSLKTSTLVYPYQRDLANVAYLEQAPMSIGFAGAKAKEQLQQSIVFAVEDHGRGSITYMIDNPLYRAFWEEGKFLFSNAVFFVGQ